MPTPPDVAVLVVAGCPSGPRAEQLMHDALSAVGLPGTPIRITLVETEEQAAELAFSGSPSFRVNGEDPYPATVGPSLACRLYRTEAGVSGLPDPGALIAALRRGRD